MAKDNIAPIFKKIKNILLQGGKINMSNWLDILTDTYGDRTSIYLERELKYPFFTGKDITYNVALDFVNRIGNVMKEIGVKKGERVVLITSNRIELVFACFAAIKIGAIAVPLNFMFRAPEIKYIVENCGAETIVIDRDVFNLNIKDKSSLPTIKKWLYVGRETPEGLLSLRDMISSASSNLSPIHISPEEVIAILYTSGTTGFPKGAMLTNEAFSRTVRVAARFSTLAFPMQNYTGIFTLPVAHIMGYIMAVIFFATAIPWVFITRFDPSSVLKIIQDYKGSIFVGVPAMYIMLKMANPDNYDLSSMRAWGAAGDAMPVEYIKMFKKYGGLKLGPIRIPPIYFEGYGQVETVGITSLKRTVFKIPTPGSVGKVVRGLKYKIVDENLKEVKQGEVGELLVKGPRVCKGYWASPEANKEAFLEDGWFRTGDLVKEIKGELFFVDREKDMIKVGGYSVFSKEVEEEIKRHPAVQEVGVIGIKDEIKGQKPVAVVELKPDKKGVTEEELLNWCKENIAFYKAPRQIKIIDQLPRGMTMKVAKKELRKMFD